MTAGPRAALGPWAGLALGVALACGAPEPPPEAAAFEGDAHPALVEHGAEFERRVYEVTDGVHVAVGFALANSILVEGDECVFVVDVLGSSEPAREVRAEFERITPKPIRALVYTHNHADHVFGGRGFVPEGSGEVEVYAHETTEYYIDRIVSVIRPIISTRSTRMFGTALPTEGADRIVNAGIGPFLEIGHGGGELGLLRPTRTFADRLETEICGVEVELVHAPGETNDQLFVWLPEKRVLMPGDNVYRAFPNLYTIRGTLYRDVLGWAKSIDAMRERRPEHLVPSHTRPVSGAEEIDAILTAYRDAIQFVHDQTIRGMNRGLTPDELVEAVRLPPHLRDHPFLQEFYGTVEWSVRSIFTGYLGWFDGDGATLSPAPPDERARGYAELAGGMAALVAATRDALDAERFEWAAELAGHALRVEPDHAEARSLKAAALRRLGQRSISPNGRNFFLTQARELEGRSEVAEAGVDESVLQVVRSIPIRNYVAALPVVLDSEKAADMDLVVGFRFPDVDEAYTIHVRRGVAEFRPRFPEDPALVFETDSDVWRDVSLQRRGLPGALASGDLDIEGSRLDAVRFLNLFR